MFEDAVKSVVVLIVYASVVWLSVKVACRAYYEEKWKYLQRIKGEFDG